MTYMFGDTEACIDLRAIPHNKPMAYAFGFMQGLAGAPAEKTNRKAYKEGRKHGRRVRGDRLPVSDPPPAWAKINWEPPAAHLRGEEKEP